MKSLYIPENQIRGLFNRLTIEDPVRIAINNLIVKYDYSYTNFFYGLFSGHSKAYVELMGVNCELDRSQIKNIIDKLLVIRREFNPSNILVGDKYDVVCELATAFHYTTNAKFKDHFYEEVYNRTESLFGAYHASEYMEDIFESIEHVTGFIESSLLAISGGLEDISTNLIFHVDIQNEGLQFIII